MSEETIAKLGSDVAAGRQPCELDCLRIREAIQSAKPMEVGYVYARLALAGCMDIEIARITARTLRNVKTISAVYARPQLRDLVSSGHIPLAMAYRAVEDSVLTGLPLLTTLQGALVESAKKKALSCGSKSDRAVVVQLPAIVSSAAGRWRDSHTASKLGSGDWLRHITPVVRTAIDRAWKLVGAAGDEIREATLASRFQKTHRECPEIHAVDSHVVSEQKRHAGLNSWPLQG